METIFNKEFEVLKTSYSLQAQLDNESRYLRISIQYNDNGFVSEYITKKTKDDVINILTVLENSIYRNLISREDIKRMLTLDFRSDRELQPRSEVLFIEQEVEEDLPLLFYCLENESVIKDDNFFTKGKMYEGFVRDGLVYVPYVSSKCIVVGQMVKDCIDLHNRFFRKIVNLSSYISEENRRVRQHIKDMELLTGFVDTGYLTAILETQYKRLRPVVTKTNDSRVDYSKVPLDNLTFMSKVNSYIRRLE